MPSMPCNRVQAERRSRVVQGEAQASLAEATTLRDVVARNVEEMERARDVTARGDSDRSCSVVLRIAMASLAVTASSLEFVLVGLTGSLHAPAVRKVTTTTMHPCPAALKRATGERALRRDVMRNLGQVKETLRATLRFSSGLVESMSESLLRCLPVHHPLGTVGLPTGAALLQPSLSAANGDVGVGLARLGGVRRLQDTVAGASPASTSGRHVAPAGSLSAVSAAFRQMASKRGRGAAGGVEGREKDTRESIRGVIGSLEDELFVLDDKYESLLKEAQQITAIINSGEAASSRSLGTTPHAKWESCAAVTWSPPGSIAGQSDADPGILEEKEVVDRAIREIKAVMSAKGAQIRQLESYLEIL